MIYVNRVKLAISLLLVFALSFVLTTNANSATNYTLNLTIIDEEASTNIALYSGEGDLNQSHGKKKCTGEKVFWINPNATSTNDLAKWTKIGNKTKVKVKNDSGKIVGIGTLSKVGWKKDREEIDEDPEIGLKVYGTCTYSQVIKVSKSNFYSIEFSGTNTVVPSFDISLSDLIKKKWNLTLTI